MLSQNTYQKPMYQKNKSNKILGYSIIPSLIMFWCHTNLLLDANEYQMNRSNDVLELFDNSKSNNVLNQQYKACKSNNVLRSCIKKIWA